MPVAGRLPRAPRRRPCRLGPALPQGWPGLPLRVGHERVCCALPRFSSHAAVAHRYARSAGGVACPSRSSPGVRRSAACGGVPQGTVLRSAPRRHCRRRQRPARGHCTVCTAQFALDRRRSAHATVPQVSRQLRRGRGSRSARADGSKEYECGRTCQELAQEHSRLAGACAHLCGAPLWLQPAACGLRSLTSVLHVCHLRTHPADRQHTWFNVLLPVDGLRAAS